MQLAAALGSHQIYRLVSFRCVCHESTYRDHSLCDVTLSEADFWLPKKSVIVFSEGTQKLQGTAKICFLTCNVNCLHPTSLDCQEKMQELFTNQRSGEEMLTAMRKQVGITAASGRASSPWCNRPDFGTTVGVV